MPPLANSASAAAPAEAGSMGAVTRIHGVWYDVSAFAAQHPGGPLALGLSYGRDATILFESCHPFVSRQRLAGLLAGMRLPAARQAELAAAYAARGAGTGVPGAPGAVDEAEVFDFSAAAGSLAAAGDAANGRKTSPPPPPMDAFEADVKALALAYFKGEAARRGVSLRAAMKATPLRHLQVAAVGLLFLASIPPLLAGWWPALVITPSLMWLYSANFWHDATHFAVSDSWVVNCAAAYAAPWFTSPLMWAHQHIIGHHSYTNVATLDPDLYHAAHVWRLQEREAWAPPHGAQHITTPIIWLFATANLMFIKPLKSALSGSFNGTVKLQVTPARILLNLLGRAAVFAVLYLWPLVVMRGRPGVGAGTLAAFCIVPNLVFSLWFMVWSQINHHASELHTVAVDRHWYRHQVQTSHTVGPQSALLALASGGLNLQIEHHLFPTVNHCHLAALQPGIAAAAAKHGVAYLCSTDLSQALRRLFAHLWDMGRKPAAALVAAAVAVAGGGAGRSGGGSSSSSSSSGGGGSGGSGRGSVRGATSRRRVRVHSPK